MSTIGLLVKPKIEAAAALACSLLEWAETKGHKVVLETETAQILGRKEGVSPEKIVDLCDPIVTLGGDGTLIGVARFVNGKPPVMVGVNFGRLGFLTEVAPEELLSTLQSVLSGKAKLGERIMLECEVLRGKERLFYSQAINDIVINKGAQDPLLDLDFSADNEEIMRLRADGVIVSTPTGSTAYSLAAGGSIVHPSVAVLLVTPICPHSLTNRPLILGEQTSLQITIPPHEGKVFLSADGQSGIELNISDRVTVRKAKNKVVFVRSPKSTYFQILRHKLSWGATHSGG